MATCRGINFRKGAVIKANLHRPHDVICQDGKYIIASHYNNRIVSVKPEDNSFRCLYEGDKYFHPYGIVALPNGKNHFLITDDGGGRDRKGCVYELTKGKLSRWAIQYQSFLSPTGIAINDKEVFVADWEANCIHVFDHSGAFVRCMGQGYLTKPWFMAFNSKNLLYVADLHIISVFQSNGTFHQSFKINTASKTWHYRGIAIDAQDNIYITARSADSRLLFTKETLSVLDKNHRPLNNFTGGWRTFNYLRGLCIDKDRDIAVVVDGEWHELKLFHLH